ncbi:MAG: enoyl-CoA hydratase/isomerase family protein [Alphaproteobacteria bacterium]
MTALPEATKIQNTLENGWLTIWFNSPENRNALSEGLTADLIASLNAVKDDRTVRGITIRGKGGMFCSGGDLKSFSAGQSGTEAKATFTKMNRGAGDMFDLILSMPQVVIAYVEGAAIAGGLGLMCCADIIVVNADAKFALTETMIGIPPAQIAPIVVGRVGLPVARRIMLTGARFTGAQTPEFNLSDFVVEDAAEFEAVEETLIKGVIKCAPEAVGVTKEILIATPHLGREAQKDFAAERFADCMMSDEGREGISSFVEKRKPNWAV